MRPGIRTRSRSSAARAVRYVWTAPPMGRSTCRACNSPWMAMSYRATRRGQADLEGAWSRATGRTRLRSAWVIERWPARTTRQRFPRCSTPGQGGQDRQGTLTLGGVNTYAGGTAVNGGTLRYRGTRTWAPWRARCRWTKARWPRRQASTARAITLGGATAASMSRRAPAWA